ncbi:MAG: xanthine phosphoribosyltransferase [Anaerofustis stercorihominis]|nr:xanthine phosphoribosyltransferase [Anaerofustis stercorihominis]
MNVLCERILKDGKVYPGHILKVDGFLNHQIDVELLENIADLTYEYFKSEGITKVLTIEASGIAIATVVSQRFGVPLLFAKKSKTKNIAGDVYKTSVQSYTHDTVYDVIVSKEYISSDDRILIVDDFLAMGNALMGLIDLTEQAGATVGGICIAIEKGFQEGGRKIRAAGYNLYSLAVIDEMTDDGKITFR